MLATLRISLFGYKMAAVVRNFRSLLFQNSTTKWWLDCCMYSRYAPKYQDPIVEESALNEFIKDKDMAHINTIFVKAAKNDLSSTVFYDEYVRKFTNHIMRKGKKELARYLLERAFTHIKHIQLRKYYKETDEEKKKEIILSPKEIFHLALRNATPVLHVQKIKKSGSWYRVPVGVHPSHAKLMAMRWLIQGAKNSKKKSERFEKFLALELIAASEYQGKAVQSKLELHKLCEANRGYAHYRWT